MTEYKVMIDLSIEEVVEADDEHYAIQRLLTRVERALEDICVTEVYSYAEPCS